MFWPLKKKQFLYSKVMFGNLKAIGNGCCEIIARDILSLHISLSFRSSSLTP